MKKSKIQVNKEQSLQSTINQKPTVQVDKSKRNNKPQKYQKSKT